MKTKILFIMMCAILSFGFSSEIYAQKKDKKKESITFLVEDMHCKNCQAKIEKNISFEKGVTDLECDLEAKTVKVTYKTDKTDSGKLIEGFAKIGMTAVLADSTKVNQ